MPTYNGKDISIHASRGGSDPFISGIIYPQERFQSTLPVGEATGVVLPNDSAKFHFNPRFPWGKRLNGYFDPVGYHDISIHASRGGSDRV
mgnify:FL=1